MDFELYQNFPNPFNPSTTLEYSLAKSGIARLSIFNVLGQRVTTLIDCFRPVGTHRVEWNGTFGNGIPVASGIYFYRLEVNGRSESQKMLLLK